MVVKVLPCDIIVVGTHTHTANIAVETQPDNISKTCSCRKIHCFFIFIFLIISLWIVIVVLKAIGLI